MLGKLFKRERPAARGQAMLTVLFPDTAPIDANAAVAAMRARLPSVRCIAKNGGDVAEFEVAGTTVFAAHMPVPIPTGEVAENAKWSRFWKGGPDATVHASHAVVFAQGEGSPADLAAAAANVALGLSASRPTVAWYVGNAGQVIMPDLAVDLVAGSDGRFQPVIWVSVLSSQDGPGLTSFSTIGMEALGKPEFEIVRTSAPHEEWLDRLYGLCDYVLVQGAVLKGGQTFGATAGERIRIEEGRSLLGKPGTVLRLLVP